MSIEIEQGEIPLTKYLKNHPTYISIFPQEGKYTGSHDESLKIKGKLERANLNYFTLIETHTSSHDQAQDPTRIFLTWTDAETLLTMLAHKPEKVMITYWRKNDSDWMRKRKLHGESIRFKGLKHNKKGKHVKTYEVAIDKIYDDSTPDFCMLARF